MQEIVRQELEIAREKVERTAAPLPVNDIADAQILIDQDPEVNSKSQRAACEAATMLTHSLAECFVNSEPSRALIWEIARRLVRARGLFLAGMEGERERELWSRSQFELGELILECSISAIPSRQTTMGRSAAESAVKPRPAESEFAATPR